MAELAARLETPEEEILAALESAAGYSPASLNAPVGGESSAEFGDLVGESDNALESVDDRVTVSGLLHRLPWRERRILAMRFYGNQTQAEIAARFGISQMHVSRLLSRALTWLRQAMLADAPPPWQNGAAETEPAKARISVRQNGDRVVVEVGGEVDRDGADQLRRAMLEAVDRAAPRGGGRPGRRGRLRRGRDRRADGRPGRRGAYRGAAAADPGAAGGAPLAGRGRPAGRRLTPDRTSRAGLARRAGAVRTAARAGAARRRPVVRVVSFSGRCPRARAGAATSRSAGVRARAGGLPSGSSVSSKLGRRTSSGSGTSTGRAPDCGAGW